MPTNGWSCTFLSHTYTECPGWNVPDFGRMFLKLKYTDITKNTYIRSWTVMEMMARDMWSSCGSMHCTWFTWCITHTPCMSVLQSAARSTLRLCYQQLSLLQLIVGSCKNIFCVFPRWILWHAFCVWILRWQCTCCCWRIPQAFSRPKDSV